MYQPPEGAGRNFVRDFYKQLVAQPDFQPTFRKHPAKFVGGIANLGWSYDADVDVDYHVRRSALPSPRRVRELLELTSRWHSSLLDRHRPLWETHIVEGLKDGRFAIYTKVHHALIDGVSAQKLMQRALSSDPDDPEIRAPWTLPKRSRKAGPSSRLSSLVHAAGSVAALAPSTVSLARAALVEQQLTLPFGAPRTMLNVKIGAPGAAPRSRGRWSGSKTSRTPRASPSTTWCWRCVRARCVTTCSSRTRCPTRR